MKLDRRLFDGKILSSRVYPECFEMSKADIVVTRREYSTVYYSLASPKIGEACDLVREVLIDQIRRNQSLAAIK